LVLKKIYSDFRNLKRGVIVIDLNSILKQIEPSKDEKTKVKDLSRQLIKIINQIAHEKGIKAEAVLLGSVAKGTWLAGKGDIDIFIKFPIKSSLEELKTQGLELGKKCIQLVDGNAEERYASHPYVTGTLEGYQVDFVPCYDINSSHELKSAVDRTILHTEYIIKNLQPIQTKEVLLLKRFMEMVGTYGSEFKVGGFSGYLLELLILNYKSFHEVLIAAANEWKPGYKIDLEKYGTTDLFEDSLVVVDPVDKNRNVAAALTLQKMAEFTLAARNFLENPGESYFYPPNLQVNKTELRSDFSNRDTKTIIIAFSAPKIPSDALHPQIIKTKKSLVKVIENEDFSVLGSDSWTDEEKTVVILLEMATWNVSLLKKHVGPKVWDRENGKKFNDKHHEAWIEGDQWMILVERSYTNVESLIQGILTPHGIRRLRVGKHLKGEILKNCQLIDVMDLLVAEYVDEQLLEFLHHYLYKNEFIKRPT
jgi:tRNA nucleotidyltransferase (CCA-adding enzyme)